MQKGWFKGNDLSKAPRLLVCAALVFMGQAIASFAFSPSITGGGSLIATVLIAALVVRGSRIAWLFAVVGTLVEMLDYFLADQTLWMLLVPGIALALLVAPASLRFIWSDGAPHRIVGPRWSAVKWYEQARAAAYRMVVRVAAWEEGDRVADNPLRRRSYGPLMARTGVTCVILLALVGFTYQWEQSSDSPAVHVIASLTWTCYAIVQLAFILVLAMAVYHYFTTRPR